MLSNGLPTSYAYNAERTLVLHGDGTGWRVVPSPNVGPGVHFLQDAAAAPGTLWAVGYYIDSSTGNGPSRALTLHWDGTGWSLVPSPHLGLPYSALASITIARAHRIWAGGSTSDGSSGQTLIMRAAATCP